MSEYDDIILDEEEAHDEFGLQPIDLPPEPAKKARKSRAKKALRQAGESKQQSGSGNSEVTGMLVRSLLDELKDARSKAETVKKPRARKPREAKPKAKSAAKEEPAQVVTPAMVKAPQQTPIEPINMGKIASNNPVEPPPRRRVIRCE